MEKQVAFSVNGQKVFGMLHEPEERVKTPGVLMFHGFTGTKVGVHRLLVKVARTLCRNGFCVLRFDFRGSGDSEGQFEEANFPTVVEDAQAALKFLSGLKGVDSSNLALVGMSMGGGVVSYLAPQLEEVKVAVLCSAIADPKANLKEILGEEGFETLEEKGEYDHSGNLITRNIFEGLDEVDLVKSLARFKGKVLIIHATADEKISPHYAEEYYRQCRKNNEEVTLHWVEGADHGFSSIPWEEEVIESITNFLKSNFT